jgi:pyridoxamine 5'-phosphate oxidase
MLEMQWQAMQRRFASGEIPLPSFWGCSRMRPLEIEFGQGRENRLHDRFRYLPGDEMAPWGIERLAP